MKINGKHLAYFASGRDFADKSGPLWKKGELNTSYQKRWCVLKGNLFFYFDKKNDKDPIGLIVLENFFVQLSEGTDSSFTFSLHFMGEGCRIYKFAAENDEVCTAWVKALSVSSYSYLNILVKSLEKELEPSTRFSTDEQQLSSNLSAGDVVTIVFENDADLSSKSLKKSRSLTNLSDASTQLDNFLNLPEVTVHTAIDGADRSLNRSQSSCDICSLSNCSTPPINSASSKKLKSPKAHQKRSLMKKLSPKMSHRHLNGSPKAGKPTSPARSIGSTNQNALRDVFTPLSDDQLIFSKLHEGFRNEIELFLSA